MREKIECEFALQDVVRSRINDGYKGYITGITVKPTGVLYEVTGWLDGVLAVCHFYDYELEGTDITHGIELGFDG